MYTLMLHSRAANCTMEQRAYLRPNNHSLTHALMHIFIHVLRAITVVQTSPCRHLREDIYWHGVFMPKSRINLFRNSTNSKACNFVNSQRSCNSNQTLVHSEAKDHTRDPADHPGKLGDADLVDDEALWPETHKVEQDLAHQIDESGLRRQWHHVQGWRPDCEYRHLMPATGHPARRQILQQNNGTA